MRTSLHAAAGGYRRLDCDQDAASVGSFPTPPVVNAGFLARRRPFRGDLIESAKVAAAVEHLTEIRWSEMAAATVFETCLAVAVSLAGLS